MIQKFGPWSFAVQTGVISINSLDSLLKKLSSIREGEKAVFQLVSLQSIVSEKQVLQAAWATALALDANACISSKPELELLLHLVGKRQVKDALPLLALPENGVVEVALVAMGKNHPQLEKKAQFVGHSLGLQPKKRLLETNFKKNKKSFLRLYGITAPQLNALKNRSEKEAIESLVLEKIALLGLDA